MFTKLNDGIGNDELAVALATGRFGFGDIDNSEEQYAEPGQNCKPKLIKNAGKHFAENFWNFFVG